MVEEGLAFGVVVGDGKDLREEFSEEMVVGFLGERRVKAEKWARTT